MSPPPPQPQIPKFGPGRPWDPYLRIGGIGGSRSPLSISKNVVIGPILSQKTVWPMYALVYPARGGTGPRKVARRVPRPENWYTPTLKSRSNATRAPMAIYFKGDLLIRGGSKDQEEVSKWSDLGPPTSGQVHWGRNGSEEAFPPTPRPKCRQKRPQTAKIQKIASDLLLGAIYF